jgi:hypothetical protein
MGNKDTKEEDLESIQKDQKKIGKADSDPVTSGPAEVLREKAAEMTDKSQDSEEQSANRVNNTCKGICIRHKAPRPVNNGNRYSVYGFRLGLLME